MKPWIGLNYGHSRTAGPPLYAGGYASHASDVNDSSMFDITIWLDDAPKFTVVFPDGFGVASRTISTNVLQDHGSSLGKPSAFVSDRGEKVRVWRSESGTSVKFTMRGDRAIVLSICSTAQGPSSNRRKDISFQSPDGASISLPIRYSDMTRLFGEPSFVNRDFALAAWPC